MSDSKTSNKARKSEQKKSYHAMFRSHLKPRARPWTFKKQTPADKKRKK